MFDLTRRTLVLFCLASFAFAAACGEPEPDPEPETAETTVDETEVAEEIVEEEPEVVAAADFPVAEDFDEEAVTQVTTENYGSVLDSLEQEIQAETAGE